MNCRVRTDINGWVDGGRAWPDLVARLLDVSAWPWLLELEVRRWYGPNAVSRARNSQLCCEASALYVGVRES